MYKGGMDELTIFGNNGVYVEHNNADVSYSKSVGEQFTNPG